MTILGVNKKDFHKSKQPINLDLINVYQIVISNKFKHSDDGFKYFIGYKEGDIVKRYVLSYLKSVDTWRNWKQKKKHVLFN